MTAAEDDTARGAVRLSPTEAGFAALQAALASLPGAPLEPAWTRVTAAGEDDAATAGNRR